MDYLFDLNYWNSNTLYIFAVLGSIAPLRSPLPSLFFFNILLKFNLPGQWLFQKHLVAPLLVGTITIHPLLFYFSLILVLLVIARKQACYISNTLPLTMSTLSYILTVTLVLGGYWGFQSTVWGYFWVNDTIEWLLLCVLLYTLSQLHVLLNYWRTSNHFLALLCILNMIAVVRLNFLPTRHSFIQNTNLFYYVLFSYYTILFACWQGPRRDQYNLPNLYAAVFTLWAIPKLLFSKSLFLLALVFLVLKVRSKFFLSGLFAHLLIVVFFTVWNVYFFFFELCYLRLFNLTQNWTIFVDQLSISAKRLSTTHMRFKDLEGVHFYLQDIGLRHFKISPNLIVTVLLNNAFLVYIFVIYLFL